MRRRPLESWLPPGGANPSPHALGLFARTWGATSLPMNKLLYSAETRHGPLADGYGGDAKTTRQTCCQAKGSETAKQGTGRCWSGVRASESPMMTAVWCADASRSGIGVDCRGFMVAVAEKPPNRESGLLPDAAPECDLVPPEVDPFVRGIRSSSSDADPSAGFVSPPCHARRGLTPSGTRG